MKHIPTLLLSLGVLWIFYVYFGYPALLFIVGRFSRFVPAAKDDFLPSVSVLISARNEEKDIGWKIAETLDWDYPEDRLDVLIASDASEDKTDEAILALCGPRVRFHRMERRVGKNEALNHLVRMTDREILFFTDANSHIPPDCLRRMIRHFADPRVGCVTGTDRTMKERDESAIGSGEKTYWGYESLIQKLESQLGSVLICFGAIFCVRRSLYTPLRPDLANDLELPVRIGSAGYSLLFEPEATATEKATQSPKEEFKRRRRICGQGALGFWALRKLLRGRRAWQFVSRKLLRWMAVVPLALIFGASIALSSNPLVRWFVFAQALFYAAALFGWLLANARSGYSKIFALPFYFVLVNLAAFVGVIDSCRGRRYSVWEVASLTRGSQPSGAGRM